MTPHLMPEMPPPLQALIFDLDGTLVDSTAVVVEVMRVWCAKHDIPLQVVLDGCHGERTEDTVRRVAPHLDVVVEAAEIDNLEGTSLAGLEPIEEAERFLWEVNDRGLAWAIATSSALQAAEVKIRACDLPMPTVLIAAESVKHGKPHPEPYLAAASALRVSPEACLVFEDAETGVKSALAAGCRVVLVGDACRLAHPNIIGRMASYHGVEFGDNGDLLVGGERFQVNG